MPNPNEWTDDDATDITDIEVEAEAMRSALENNTYSRSSLLAQAQAIKTKAIAMKMRHQ